MLLSALVIGSSHLHQKSNALYNVLTVRNLGHSPHSSEDFKVWAMDSTSQWQALKVALQREAEDIFYSAGEVVVVERSGMSEFELLVISRTKHMKILYVPERSAVRWETPNEYGFEPLSGPVALLAATLMRLVYRR